MWAVVGNAFTARRGQAVIIAMVALLAAAAVAAAPWYALAATQQVGVAAVEGAPVEDRLISATWRPVPGPPSPADLASEFQQQFTPPGFTSVVGGFATGDLRNGGFDGASIEVNVAFREDICEHLVVTGSCPSSAGEIVLAMAAADGLGLSVGDELEVEHAEHDGNTARRVVTTVRLVGVYHVADPDDPYWGDGSVLGQGTGGDAERETAFAVREALADYYGVTYTYDLVAAPQAFATADLGELGATLDAGQADLRRQGYSVTSGGLNVLIDRIARDRQNVAAGVGVGVVVLLLLTGFTLVVVLRGAVVQTRGDVGWWRLRGAPAGRGWILVLGQSVVPMVCGVAIGAAAGLVLGFGLGGTIGGTSANRTALLLALGLVGLTVAVGLVAVLAAQLGTLRTPVRDLFRHVPMRRARWRRSLVDLVLVVFAVAAVGQALAVGPTAAGLARLAPALAVLALVLIAAWSVRPLVAWVAARALHAGWLATALVAASMARRPGTHRLFALAGVAVALVTTAFIGWDTGERTHWQRAALEVGADRVVTVAAGDTAQLLSAVRAVDPAGTEAMAVVHRPGVGEHPPMLAVDSSRLGAVAGWREEYGGDIDDVTAALRPAAPEPAVIGTDQLELEVAATDPSGDAVYVQLLLRSLDTGEPVEALVGPLGEEPDTYAADVPACAAGCRLVGVHLLGPAFSDAAEEDAGQHAAPSSGAQVELFRLAAGEGAAAVEPAVLAEPARWRPALGPRDLGLVVTASDGALRLTVPASSPDVPLDRNDWAFVADTPAPLPVVAAGWRPGSTAEARLAPLAGAAVPIEVASFASLVPRFGAIGVMADLEYAERVVPFPLAVGTSQVWLSPTAATSIVDDLREAGLTPLRQESLSDHLERLGAEGGAVGVRFQAPVALVGLALVAGAVVVHAAQERTSRAVELARLRAQGVGPVVVRVVAYGGLAGVIGAVVIAGLIAGIVGARIARVLHPGFVDGWAVLPTAALHLYPVAAAAAITVVVLGAAAIAAGVALVRRTDSVSGSGLRRRLTPRKRPA